MPSYAYGGQALMEGVLMRGRDAIAVALRHPDGRIVIATERLDSGLHAHRAAKWPFIRGLIVLYETLVVGTRWLIRSANVQAEEDDVELGKGSIIVMLLITFGVAIAIFSLLPLFISSVATSGSDQGWAQPVLEGIIQVGIFLGYLALVSRAPDIHRVFQYHGAEHMTIHALEAGDPLTVDEVRKYPTAHHRCGTEFLVILVMLSIFAFSLVGKQPPLIMIASRFILIPVLAAVGYEILKFGATVPEQPARQGDHVSGHPRPDDHDQAPRGRHDRGRDHLHAGSPDRGWQQHPRGLHGLRALDHRLRAETGRRRGGTPRAQCARRRRGRPASDRMSDLDAKLAEIAAQYDDVQAELSRPEVSADPSEIRRLGKELARLEPTVEAFRRLEATRAELAGARELRDAADARRRDGRDGPR